jgi:hypothetical protein
MLFRSMGPPGSLNCEKPVSAFRVKMGASVEYFVGTSLLVWHLLPNTQYLHGRINYKDTKPYMSAFLKIDLLTDFAALCLTYFIDWRYIHSVVSIFDPACELLPPWTKELYLCTVAPLLYLYWVH